MKRQHGSLALLCCIMLMFFPVLARADWEAAVLLDAEVVDSGECGAEGDNVTWTLDSDGLLKIEGSGAMADYEREHTPWMSYWGSIKTVQIENGVTTIGNNAFFYLNKLTDVTIPNSVTAIGDYAFYASGLTSVTIPDNVVSIGSQVFASCSHLQSVSMSYGITNIAENMFASCRVLTNVTIPDSVTTIEDFAFWYCDSLTTITIPDSVTNIGSSVFVNCNSLANITVDENNPNYSDLDGVLFDKNQECLVQYPQGKEASSYIIPDSVTTIGDSAFLSCGNLTSVTIPDSVTTIESNAFNGSGLTSVTIPDSVTDVGSQAFLISSLTNITVDDNNPSYSGLDGVLFDKAKKLLIQYPLAKESSSYAIPDSVTTIGHRAFSDCLNLTSIIIPDSVTTIAYHVFSDCRSLTSVTIPDSVTYIGFYAFEGCHSLTSVIIPDDVTSIEGYTFYRCDNLTDVTIPASVKNIDYGAFERCNSLTDVYYKGSEESWNSIKIESNNDPLTDAELHFIRYTVTWLNYNGNTLEVDENIPYGDTPNYDGETPERVPVGDTAYEFAGWTPAVEPVSGNVTYTAQFTETPRTYTITWKNDDGTVLETDDNVAYGSTPVYDGETPEKPMSQQYTYTFRGWDKTIRPVSENVVYTAVYSSALRTYAVTWVNEDGTVLETDEAVPYGRMPTYDGETPVKEADETGEYAFAGWTPEIAPVSGAITYTAEYLPASYAAVGEITISETTVSAEIVCFVEATAICAAYSENGQAVDVRTCTLDNMGTYEFQFGESEFDYVKVFLMDGDMQSLCASRTGGIPEE